MTDHIEAIARGIAVAFALQERKSENPDPTVEDPEFWKMFTVMAAEAEKYLEASGYRIVPVEPTEEMVEAASAAMYPVARDSAVPFVRGRTRAGLRAAMLTAYGQKGE